MYKLCYNEETQIVVDPNRWPPVKQGLWQPHLQWKTLASFLLGPFAAIRDTEVDRHPFADKERNRWICTRFWDFFFVDVDVSIHQAVSIWKSLWDVHSTLLKIAQHFIRIWIWVCLIMCVPKFPIWNWSFWRFPVTVNSFHLGFLLDLG